MLVWATRSPSMTEVPGTILLDSLPRQRIAEALRAEAAMGVSPRARLSEREMLVQAKDMTL
jgi:hypothetical protein